MKTCFRFSLLAVVLLWATCRPAVAQPVQNGFMAVTCYSDGNSNGPVVGLIDVTLAHLQTVNQHWPAPTSHGPASQPWTRANLGEVFGIAFDQAGNIYVSATSVYGNGSPGGPGGSGAIYKLDWFSGAISTFATLPNNGSGLGNIAWDAAFNQMFATNFEDGKIYRIDAAGVVQSTFDPFNPDGGSSKPAPLGERLWGIGVYNNRVYFAVWNENCNQPSNILANEIWSVALDGTGDFLGSEQLEITIPTLPSSIHSNPVSDIAFSGSGNMLVAERTMMNSSTLQPNAHASRVLEYGAPAWTLTGNVFNVGIPGPASGCGSYPTIGAGSAGGVDYAYGTYNSTTMLPEDCDGAIWASGDVLKWSGGELIYGFQRLPSSGGNAASSVLIDADGITSGAGSGDKTHIGDVEVYKDCDSPPPGPCDDVEVSLTDLGDCCYELTITGVGTPSPFTSVSATLLTAGVTFTGAVGPSGWSATNLSTTATWTQGGTIPPGTTNGLEFCVSTTVSAPQQVLITLHAADGTVCEYILNLNCEPPAAGPCVVVNDDEIECTGKGPNGWEYDFSFTVTNYSPFSQTPWNLPAEHLLVYGSGLTITPAATALVPSLNHGATSGTLNYTMSGPGLQPGDTICITLQLHGAQVGDGYRWCCPPEMFYFVLPPCRDCCDSVDITIGDHSVRQIGNTAASVGSPVNVSPKPLMKVQANIMNVSRSRIWCPDATGLYVPVSSPTTIGAVITGGTISPSMPVSSGFTPPTGEVIWGTIYSGVNFSSGSIGLNLAFPGTSLGWRCRDTLTVCVRYSFTDTSWVTCDTVVYFKIPRCGRVDIAAKDDDVVPASFGEVVQGQGISVGEPLYSNVVAGPAFELSMSSEVQGSLSVAHWWQDAPIALDKIRLVRMHVTPEPGIDITNLTPQAGGEAATITDRTATVAVDLREGETDVFDIDFDNPTNADFFALRITFDYVDTDDPETELASREYVVYGDLGGGSPEGRIEVVEASKSNPVLYKLLIGSNANHSADWISPACFRFTPPEGVRILASGPMPDSGFAEFHVLKSFSRASSLFMQLPSPGDYRKESIPQEKTLELWLVLEGDVNVFDLDWEALNMDGEMIGSGSVELSPTSTVRDGDDIVPGAAIHLLEAYPNPTEGSVTTGFNLTRSERVSLAVYDLSGREVARVVDNELLNAGSYRYDLNLKSLPSGAYYIRMKTDAGTQTQRIVRK